MYRAHVQDRHVLTSFLTARSRISARTSFVNQHAMKNYGNFCKCLTPSEIAQFFCVYNWGTNWCFRQGEFFAVWASNGIQLRSGARSDFTANFPNAEKIDQSDLKIKFKAWWWGSFPFSPADALVSTTDLRSTISQTATWKPQTQWEQLSNKTNVWLKTIRSWGWRRH